MKRLKTISVIVVLVAAPQIAVAGGCNPSCAPCPDGQEINLPVMVLDILNLLWETVK